MATLAFISLLVLASAQDLDCLNKTLLPLPYILPSRDPAPSVRAADIETKRATFLYGPGVDGGVSSPAGCLGMAYTNEAKVLTDAEAVSQSTITTLDSTNAQAGSFKYDGLKTVDDYTKLYDQAWVASSQPTGIDPGMLTNYTSDLLFSMSRLSFSPFTVRRLAPSESLPFQVDDTTAKNVTGDTLSSLLSSGRLFYGDHRDQKQLPQSNLYAPACDAYFYISQSTSQFLPLAIRSNINNSLVYTPADTANDWLLAKMMFEISDFYFSQIDHLARTHWVVEVVYQAAVRTLSDRHPVLGLLDRLMYGAFGIRQLAEDVLFSSGGVFDQFFGFNGATTASYARTLYYNTSASSFKGNYFLKNLEQRGLLNPTVGPALQSFPFYEDALPIHNAISNFTNSFVNSYYVNGATVSGDKELQAWLKETNGPAGGIDFPTSSDIKTSAQLADLLTHFAYLVSANHHTINTNQLITGAGVYPLHLQALNKPVPTSKGVQDIVSYLPTLDQCIGFLKVEANFARPLLANSNRSLTNMFNDLGFLGLANDATRTANSKFMSDMNARSQVVSSRGFDDQGLSQDMPFVWRALDPNVAPWSLTI